jgi:hypothetical protein
MILIASFFLLISAETPPSSLNVIAIENKSHIRFV